MCVGSTSDAQSTWTAQQSPVRTSIWIEMLLTSSFSTPAGTFIVTMLHWSFAPLSWPTAVPFTKTRSTSTAHSSKPGAPFWSTS